MAQSRQSNTTPAKLADRLATVRHGRFVGRETELALFRSALLAELAPFVVLHVYGPGGVGKTTLLHEYARVARTAGRTAVLLDGHNLELSPIGFTQAWHMALAQQGSTADSVPQKLVLLIDTYELMTPLDGWLRHEFLPQLPSTVLIVFAGRRAPAAAWRTEPDWGHLTRLLPLPNLNREESQTYLTVRGIPATRHEDLLTYTHGHPLALSLAADVLGQGDGLTAFNPHTEPDIVRVLLERFTRNVPDAQHRQALEICAHVRVTSEALLAHFLGHEAAYALFDWLSSLSFIQQGAQGLFPHDLARDVLDANFRWRNAQAYETMHHTARRFYERELGSGANLALSADVIYLLRYYAALDPYFDWNILSQAYMERATPADHPFILQMIRQHEGEEAEAIARYWLQKQPQGFIIFRTIQEQQFGFVVVLMLPAITVEDVTADPALVAAHAFMQKQVPLRPPEVINVVRFWMGRHSYQEADVQTLVAMNSSATWISHRHMAWTFACTAVPQQWQGMFSRLNFDYTGEADFTVGGHRYGVFTHNWRTEPVGEWLEWLGAQYFQYGANPASLALSQTEFAEAVRQALRDFTRPHLLANNPLMRTKIVRETADPSPTTLQQAIQQAADSLTASPKEEKFYAAVYRTYLKPAPSQEAAAELLNLPFGTYRYRLAQGVERIADWLWTREQA
ncbi:MAG: ATP-binding protein [Anaerolineaceae bacterium]|nr:ATP-binding protein [Anaerolineaceae bacterium]